MTPRPNKRAAVEEPPPPAAPGSLAPVGEPEAGALHSPRRAPALSSLSQPAAVTGTDPATGTEGPCKPPPVPGRDRATSPAGSAINADDALPAGSTGRTFTIALPAGLKLLSLNGREHWAEKGRRHKALKNAAWAMARQARIPRLERVSVVVEYQPPPVSRRRDADNPSPSAKACLDGIVAAGVLQDDECPRYVTGIWCTIGEPHPGGRLVLHLTEVTA